MPSPPATGRWRCAPRASLERRDALLPDAPLPARRRGVPRPRLARRRAPRSTRSSASNCSPSRCRCCAPGSPSARARAIRSAFLPAERSSGAAAAYAAEHRPLLLLATAGREEAADAARAPPAGRSARAAAAHRRRRHCSPPAATASDALALLEGEEPPLVAARALVEARRPVPGAIGNAAAGVAELLVRLALDMHAPGADRRSRRASRGSRPGWRRTTARPG